VSRGFSRIVLRKTCTGWLAVRMCCDTEVERAESASRDEARRLLNAKLKPDAEKQYFKNVFNATVKKENKS